MVPAVNAAPALGFAPQQSALRHQRRPVCVHTLPLPHHGVRVVDPDVVVLAADGLLHKGLVDALPVELHKVLVLRKARRVGRA